MAAGMLSATLATAPVNAAEFTHDQMDNRYSNIPYGAIAKVVIT